MPPVDNMKIIAVVPAFNESTVIDEIINGLKSRVSVIIVVDDGSSDNTGEIAREAGAIVVRHLVNRGQGAALETGRRLALEYGADIILHFDGDGQHDPQDVSAMVGPIIEGRVDVVLGSRFLGSAIDLPLARRLILRLAVLFTRFFSGLKLTDAHNGLRAMSTRAARHLRLTYDGMAHASEFLDIMAEKKLNYLEAPVTVRYTPYSIKRGQNSWNGLTIVYRLIIDKFFHKS